MLSAIVKVKFTESISVDYGIEYLKKTLTSGSSKEIAIPYKNRRDLCKFHKEVECEILKKYDNNTADIRIDFPYCLSGAASGISELLNSLLYCSVFSFVENYIVEDFSIERATDIFKGPRFGISGIRDMEEIYQTPLMGVILKPRTKIDLRKQEYYIEELCESGLINYVIDDELVVSPNCCQYTDKISAYVRNLKEMEQKIGKHILYWINATADIEISKKIIDFSILKGINTFCLNPITMGFGAFKYLVDLYENEAVFLANNIGRGVISRPTQYYISEKVLAKLSRLIGADAVYTGPISSSFPYDTQILRDERQSLQGNFCGFKQSFAVASGDISEAKNIGENVKAIGNDVMIQMGSGLMGCDSNEKLKAFSFIANYALNEGVLKQVQDALITIQQDTIQEGNISYMDDKNVIKKRSEQLVEYIGRQLFLRNEYKQSLTETRDPQEIYKYKFELDKCENTILEFTYELNNLCETNPDLIDLDCGTYKIILQIVEERISTVENVELSGVVDNLDELFNKTKEVIELNDEIKDRYDSYSVETTLSNKLELSFPIIPLLLNYKVELSFEGKYNLRKVLLKILQLARRKK